MPWPSGRTVFSDYGFASGYQTVKRFVRKLRGSRSPQTVGIILAAFEMEMDRGRADSQRLGEPAQAEPVCADAAWPTPNSLASLRRLNPFAPTLSISLAAAATIAAFVRPARVPAFRFSLTIGLEVFFLGIVMMATMTLAMSRERGASRANW